MIISDLNHFEEVVSEAASIVGGEDAFSLPDQLFADVLAQLQLPASDFTSPLEITIETASVTTPLGGTATATVGTFTAGEQAGGSFASSSAIA